MKERNESILMGLAVPSFFAPCGLLCLAVMLAAGQVSASRTLSQDLPASAFADTEVSTNFLLRTHRTDVRQFDLHLELDGSQTNNLEIAFGCDTNTNGLLDVDEVETVYGWRGGRYFVENVREWNRIATEAATNAPYGVLDIRVATSPKIVPRRFIAVCGGSAAFTEWNANPPEWLFRKKWDAVRIVRRGVGAPSDWVQCEVKYDSFAMILR